MFHIFLQNEHSNVTTDKCRHNTRHRHQTPPRYRNAASRSSLRAIRPRIASAYHPRRPNVMSSIKPEVPVHRRQRKTEPRSQGIWTKNSRRSVQRSQRYARRQTERQTDRQADRNIPLRDGVTTSSEYRGCIEYQNNILHDIVCV